MVERARVVEVDMVSMGHGVRKSGRVSSGRKREVTQRVRDMHRVRARCELGASSMRTLAFSLGVAQVQSLRP